MDTENPIVKQCLLGAQDEFRGRLSDACEKYRQAWKEAKDDYECCIAAHYLARCQPTEKQTLEWNLRALKHAQLVSDNRVDPFWGSLYVNIGQSYETLGHPIKAKEYYQLAAAHGLIHQKE